MSRVGGRSEVGGGEYLLGLNAAPAGGLMKQGRKRVFLGLNGQRGNVMSEEIGVAGAKVTFDVIKE